jgi:hypothetical protein
MERDAGTDAVLRVVEDVLRDALEAGRAQIDVVYSEKYPGWSSVEVSPQDGRACPVSVSGDAPPQIWVFLGREPIMATFELWREDHDANLGLLRELVEAVGAGRYEQNIETFKNNRVRVTGRFQLEGREQKHEHSTTASAVVKPGESYVVRFAPY